VGPENRELDFLPRLNATINDKPIRRIPTFYYRTATLTRRARQFAINPDFGVIIDRCLENGSRTRNIDVVHALWNRDVDSVPTEAKPPGRPPRIECGWVDLFPFGVVEIRATSVWSKIISLDRFAGRLFIRASSLEIDLNDFGVAITPLTFDEIDTFFGGEIDHCVRFSSRRIRICFRKRAASQQNQRAKGCYRSKAQAPHGRVHRGFAMFPIK